MENYTAYYRGSSTTKVDGRVCGSKTVEGYEQYSFFAHDDAAARSTAEDFAWRFNHSSWSGPTIGLEKIVEKDCGKTVFESQ